jgi:3-hydroxyisobutyrate dehydrogenase
MKIGFIGLGHLGKAIARRLISEGLELMVWNRTAGKATDLGVPVAESPAQLAQKVDTLMINLFDSRAVKSVLFKKDGLIQGGLTGKTIIDTSTNHFEEVLLFHDILKSQGGHYLEAPVLGSVVPASQGALVSLVSGDKKAYEDNRFLLEKICRKLFYLEEPGSATKMKLINNLLLGTFMAALAEALVLGEASGLSKKKALEILNEGAGQSMVLNAKRDKLLTEDFTSHFSSALMYKDLHYLQDLARSLRKTCFLTGVTKELFGLTFSKNRDALDFSAIYQILKKL